MMSRSPIDGSEPRAPHPTRPPRARGGPPGRTLTLEVACSRLPVVVRRPRERQDDVEEEPDPVGAEGGERRRPTSPSRGNPSAPKIEHAR